MLVVCLDGLRFVEGEADEVVEADAGEPSQICHGGFDAGLAREQVDVPRGARVDGSGKHALAALQDKGRIRVAEDAAQQPVEVEAGDGAVVAFVVLYDWHYHISFPMGLPKSISVGFEP